MYWFGENLGNSDWMDERNWSSLSNRKKNLFDTPIDHILSLLDGFGQTWRKGSQSYQEAIPQLVQESGFSPEEVENTLALLTGLLSRDSLEQRLRSEFGQIDILDRFTKPSFFAGKVRAVPSGVILHVTAGNVFLSSIDSLIMGFVTKNLSLLKVSSSNRFFPMFFAEKLFAYDQKKILSDKFAVVHWKGGDEKTETFIKNKVNTIVAWGGEEMISSYRKNLREGVKLLDFGPKISFQVITAKGLESKDFSNVGQKIVQDIVPWDQSACASPQNLYLQESVDEQILLHEIKKAFDLAPSRGVLSDDEATEILKEKFRGLYSQLMKHGKFVEGENSLLHLEEGRHLRPSPLHRSLIIKRFKDEDELFSLVEPFSYYLQSCSYLFGTEEKEKYLELLSLAGIKRFSPLGTITWGMEGAPHDGRFVLRELVSFIGDEARSVDYGEKNLVIEDATGLKKYFDTRPHPKGYIFSSGGTTGEPKFVHFSYEEMDYITDMLEQNFRAQGIRAGTVVANLFVAGNLWSSFIAVNRALEKIGAIQLPIGGLCSQENILFYLKKFQPEVVMGIPSLLIMTAELAKSQDVELKVDKVFYAGEALSLMRREFLEKNWSTTYFGSAGYASVDAGVIGYQCDRSAPGEHHVFSDFIHLQIIDDEAVVTSLVRDTIPVINYRTGDRVEWISECSCGRKDPRFRLLGRIDNVLQVWSCRLLLSDIEQAIQDLDHEILTFQIVLTEKKEGYLVKETLEIFYEVANEELSESRILQNIYERSRDLRDTLSFEKFQNNIKINAVGRGKIPRNPRTGKISLVLDHRH